MTIGLAVVLAAAETAANSSSNLTGIIIGAVITGVFGLTGVLIAVVANRNQINAQDAMAKALIALATARGEEMSDEVASWQKQAGRERAAKERAEKGNADGKDEPKPRRRRTRGPTDG